MDDGCELQVTKEDSQVVNSRERCINSVALGKCKLNDRYHCTHYKSKSAVRGLMRMWTPGTRPLTVKQEVIVSAPWTAARQNQRG